MLNYYKKVQYKGIVNFIRCRGFWMKKKGLLFFNAYRYLLIPQDYIQMDFYKGIEDKESLNQKKNVLFSEFVRSLPTLSFSTIKFQVLEGKDNLFLMKMGLRKHALIGTPELIEKEIEDWHSVYVAFDFSRQMFLIQHKTKVCAETSSLANKLLEIFRPYVKKISLNIQINPILKKNLFWDIVKKYDKRIREVDFVLTAPNFAEITKYLGEEIEAAMRSTTAAQAKVVLSSDEQSVLTLSEEDPHVASMAKYAQEGGGRFSIRLVGLKRKTSKEGAKEISVDSAAIEGNGSVIPCLKDLFNDAEN